jgi:hypothetical protein
MFVLAFKLQEKPLASKRELPALQNRKFFFGSFCLPESGSRDQLNPDIIRIRKLEEKR